MQKVDLDRLDLREERSSTDPSLRLRYAFPVHAATGAASSSAVYFELDPGARLGTHADSAEELLLVLEGRAEATVGAENGRLEAGDLALVPANVPHDVRNVGSGVLRVLGFFSGSTVVSAFHEPMEPDGPWLFVSGVPAQALAPPPASTLAV